MINGNASPALKENRLRSASPGKIGRFPGTGTEGAFRKLVYTGK